MPSKPCSNCHTTRPIFMDGNCHQCHVDLVTAGGLSSSLPMPRRCPVEGCSGYVAKRGLCDRHYRRVLDHGTTEKVRKVAEPRKHPFYKNWLYLRKHGKMCPEWADFEVFLSVVGDRPSPRHRLMRSDTRLPYSPTNWFWRKPVFDQALAFRTKEGKAQYDKAYQQHTRAHTPDYWAHSQRRRNYGMVQAEFDALLEKQGSVCAICSRPETKRASRTGRILPLSVDHDHATKAVRGLLCGSHNSMLGYAEDSPSLLASAIVYLARHSKDGAAVLQASISTLQGALQPPP